MKSERIKIRLLRFCKGVVRFLEGGFTKCYNLIQLENAN